MSIVEFIADLRWIWKIKFYEKIFVVIEKNYNFVQLFKCLKCRLLII